MRGREMVRMSGKTAPRGVVTDEMLARHDWYGTFAALAGALDKVPAARPMNSVGEHDLQVKAEEKMGIQTM